MDGGTEWEEVQSWLEMADRTDDLLALLAAMPHANHFSDQLVL